MTALGAETVLQQAADIVVEEFEDGVVIWAPTDGTLHRLDLQGKAVWELLDGRRDLAGVAAELAERYAVSLVVLLPDVVSFAQKLEGMSLAEPATAS